MEDILEAIREPARNDVHHEVQSPPVRRHPGIEISDVGSGIRGDGWRVEMIRAGSRFGCDDE
jgi:hypothetical protein